MFRQIIYIGMILAAGLVARGCAPRHSSLRTGDLLFQVGAGSEMAGAIEAATANGNTLTYTHVGIALPHPGADSVLEATSDGGVRIVPLAEFLAAAAQTTAGPAVTAMRLRDTAGVARSVARARNCVGLPYDYAYRPDNGKFYCSELVWENYRRPDGRRIFAAQPMNFRAPDGTMPEFWIRLFERLGEPIPEGEPGTNPNDMARDAALEPVGRCF